MVRDELYIKERFGQENPFKVPDGYFEKFADQMMNQLPDKQTGTVKVHRNVWSSVRPALISAGRTEDHTLRCTFTVPVCLSGN